MCDQLDKLDEKLVEVITVLKSLEKRVHTLEKIAKEKGLLQNTKRTTGTAVEESCIVM